MANFPVKNDKFFKGDICINIQSKKRQLEARNELWISSLWYNLNNNLLKINYVGNKQVNFYELRVCVTTSNLFWWQVRYDEGYTHTHTYNPTS